VKILILSQYFWPENFKINDLSSELASRGHDITIITGKPNYPKGKFYKGFGLFSKIKNDYNGATIYRLPIIPRGNASGFMLSLNYLSFTLIGSFFLLFHRKKYDFSFVYAVSPLTSAIPAIVHRKIFNTKLILWIQDLWPEGVEVTGKMKSPLLRKLLNSCVRFIYKQSDKIFISSQFMRKSILEKINSKNNKDISYLPNWAESTFFEKNVDINKYSSLIPNGFIVMFAGNIGFGQDCPSIIKVAQLIKSQQHIKFVILGDGSEKLFLEQQIRKLGLQNTVFLLGSYPIEEMPHFYYHADMMLLTLRNELIYSFTVPIKLQSYLASKKPVAAMINGEAADIIKRCNCGIVVGAEDYKSFAEEVMKIYKMPNSYLKEMGQNGYNYYEKTFTKEIVIESLLNV